MSLSPFHSLIESWFTQRFGAPTDAQRLGWPSILRGRNTLIAAPTGSGKTLAAFLASLDDLIRRALDGRLADQTHVLYISPLKALSNDIQRNLETPLKEIREIAERDGISLPEIRVLVRTGDTPAVERQRMIRKPPHILITTPESFYILLTTESSRRILRTVETVIVDEIHAVARDKRGSHLSLSLERLDHLCDKKPVRIGLSATQKPVEEMARLLVGTKSLRPDGSPDCTIVDTGHLRTLDLAIESPKSPLGAVCTNEQWKEVYEQVAELIRQHRSTLVFVNTRRMAERITHHLSELLGEDQVASHHGSLSKKIRLHVEERLKSGELKAVVATASLELGIDIGFIDLVVQIGTPRSIAVFLQRIGRSGHALKVTPKGRLFALTLEEMVECAALIRAIRGGRLDRILMPEGPLDILAQQIVAAAASEEWNEEDLFAMARGAYPYRDLRKEDFDELLTMLSEGFASRKGRSGAYLHHDRIGRRIKARRGARLAAVTSGGAIPERADYKVVAEPERVTVGSVDEDFAVESMAGDVFVLGNTSWRIQQIRLGEVVVVDAHGAAPGIPFWLGEAPARTIELSEEVSRLRGEIAERLSPSDGTQARGTHAAHGSCGYPGRDTADSSIPIEGNEAARWLSDQSSMSIEKAEEVVDYMAAQQAAVGMVPAQDHLLIERFFDESGGMQLVIHSPYGGRINRAMGLTLRKRFCRRFDFELQASADDNGVVLSLGPQQSFPLTDVPRMVSSKDALHLLSQALLAAPVFRIRWRWNVTRALAVLRQQGGRKVPPPLQRFRADDLLVSVFPAVAACAENLPPGDIPIPEHPMIRQTIDDALHEAMDVDGLIHLLSRIESGAIRVTCADTREPTPFAYPLLNAQPYAFLDDAPLEERRARAVSSRRSLTVESVRDLGKLDPEAIARVREEAWPLVRDADELHDTLLTAGLFPEGEGKPWQQWFDELRTQGRALQASDPQGRRYWLAAEHQPLALAARPELNLENRIDLPPSLRREWTGSEAWMALIRGRMELVGPVTVTQLAQALGLSPSEIAASLEGLEGEGYVLRGHFTPDAAEPEWCVRRLLARIHRLTLDRLRNLIAPVSPESCLRFLLRWNRLAPKTQAQGKEGVLAVIERLQGFEVPAILWERTTLPGRVAKYDPAWLDHLCLSGEVIWGRVRGGIVREANRILPISFMLREDYPWLRSEKPMIAELDEEARQVLSALTKRGALFFKEIVPLTRLLPTQVENALWELAAAGYVSGDGFEAVRGLTSPLRGKAEALRRRRTRRGLPTASHRLGTGRWWVLNADNGAEQEDPLQREKRLEGWGRQLLNRYGVIFRDLLTRESAAPSWRDLLPVYRRMESRGEIRGGRFVKGVGGEQFAWPEVIDLLRQAGREETAGELVVIPAADPMNLVGILTPGARLAATAANLVVYRGGRPVGTRQGQERWTDPEIPTEQAGKVEQMLRTGKY